MLNFNYTLDNELTVPVGRIPSGIQVQAFEMALSRMAWRYNTAKRLLGQKVPGLGKGPTAGMSKDWQLRLISQLQFLDRLPDVLLARANNVAHQDNANAAVQGRGRRLWNSWSQEALQAYGRAIGAFEAEISKAMSNAPVSGMPVALINVAKIAGAEPPVLLDAKKVGLGSVPVVDDPDYLAEISPAPMLLGAIAGAAAVGLAAWWFGRNRQGTQLADDVNQDALIYGGYRYAYQDPRDPGPMRRKKVCKKWVYRTVRARDVTPGGGYVPGGQIRRKYCQEWGYEMVPADPWKEDCPGCFPRRRPRFF